MKEIKSNNYKQLKISGGISEVSRLVQKGLSIETAIEQVFGVGKLNRSQIENIKKDVNRIGRQIPIKSI